MSRNYDSWERLVAAVLKREQIRQLCHQDSVSTIYSDYSSSQLEFSLPVSLGTTDTFEFVRTLKEGKDRNTDLVQLAQDVQVWDHQCIPKGTEAVVKSLTDNTWKMTRDEFEQLMIVVGNCRHENVAAPWGYRFSETTKLVVYDYYKEGSVFDMLHGNTSSTPSWESRLRIAVGAAHGIAHIHAQCGGNLAHGNIKSSSIFLNSKGYGSVSDLFGVSEHEPTQKSDIYSFGQLLIELVTRELPTDVSPYFIRFQSLVSDEWYLNDFVLRRSLLVDELDVLWADSELLSSAVVQEARRMLEVAKRCLSLLEEERPPMSQVALELESITAGQGYSHGGVKNAASSWHRFFRFGR